MDVTLDSAEVQPELIVLCSIGTRHFGFPARWVQEILKPPVIRKVHHAPSFLFGVFNLRGRIVELLDPVEKFCLEKQNTPDDSRIMVLESGEGIVGVLVDSVVGVFPYEPGAVKPIPENLDPSQREITTGFLKVDDKLVALIDVEAFLRDSPDGKKLSPRVAPEM